MLANVLSEIVWTLEEREPNLTKDRSFKDIKRVTHEVREVFHNLGIQLSVLQTCNTFPSNPSGFAMMEIQN